MSRGKGGGGKHWGGFVPLSFEGQNAAMKSIVGPWTPREANHGLFEATGPKAKESEAKKMPHATGFACDRKAQKEDFH